MAGADPGKQSILQPDLEPLVIERLHLLGGCDQGLVEPVRALQRWIEVVQAAARAGSPSVNFSPSRRVKVQASSAPETLCLPTIRGLRIGASSMPYSVSQTIGPGWMTVSRFDYQSP
jgi:hypothetical protein